MYVYLVGCYGSVHQVSSAPSSPCDKDQQLQGDHEDYNVLAKLHLKYI